MRRAGKADGQKTERGGSGKITIRSKAAREKTEELCLGGNIGKCGEKVRMRLCRGGRGGVIELGYSLAGKVMGEIHGEELCSLRDLGACGQRQAQA